MTYFDSKWKLAKLTCTNGLLRSFMDPCRMHGFYWSLERKAHASKTLSLNYPKLLDPNRKPETSHLVTIVPIVFYISY